MIVSKYNKDHKLEVFQSALRRNDTMLRKVIALRAEPAAGDKDGYTIAEHDPRTKKDKVLHVVVIDDAGNIEPPEGTAEAFRGRAWIEGNDKPVAVCR